MNEANELMWRKALCKLGKVLKSKEDSRHSSEPWSTAGVTPPASMLGPPAAGRTAGLPSLHPVGMNGTARDGEDSRLKLTLGDSTFKVLFSFHFLRIATEQSRTEGGFVLLPICVPGRFFIPCPLLGAVNAAVGLEAFSKGSEATHPELSGGLH